MSTSLFYQIQNNILILLQIKSIPTVTIDIVIVSLRLSTSEVFKCGDEVEDGLTLTKAGFSLKETESF